MKQNSGGIISGMRISDIARKLTGPSAAELHAVREAAENRRLHNEQVGELKERLYELEHTLLSPEWRRFMDEGERSFSRDGLRTACRLSRLMFLSNPLINRSVTLKSQYVFGQGVSVTTEKDGDRTILSKFWNARRNKRTFTSHQKMTLREQDLQVNGNMYVCLVTSPNGEVTIRCIPADEVEEIITNPEDAGEVWYYRRRFKKVVTDSRNGSRSQPEEERYYPDIDHHPTVKEETFAGKPIEWNMPVYHVAIGALPDMPMGLPETYQSIPWARQYKEFLTDFIGIVKNYRKFAFTASVDGGVDQVSEVHAALNSTYGTGANYSDTVPPPVVGSTMVSSGINLQPVKTAGATVPLEEGRRLLLMNCAGSGFPETFYGDASVGSLATAQSLDRPTELMITDRQELWKDIFSTIGEYVLLAARRQIGTPEERPVVTVSFPPIVEHDIQAYIGAIISAATLDGKTLADTADFETFTRLLLEALGVKNIDQLVRSIVEAKEKKEAEAAKLTASLPGADEDEEEKAAADGDEEDEEPEVKEAATSLRKLRGQLQRLAAEMREVFGR